MLNCVMLLASAALAATGGENDVKPVDFKLITMDVEDVAPRLRLELPNPKGDTEELFIRFPELISLREGDETERYHLYVDNVHIPSVNARLTCPVGVKLPVKWQHDGNTHSFVLDFENGISTKASVKQCRDGLELVYELTNGTDKTLSDVSIWNCLILSKAPYFRNARLERTYVPMDGRMFCMFDLVDPEEFPEGCGKHFNGSGTIYPSGVKDLVNPKVTPSVMNPEKTTYTWRAPKVIDMPLLAETSNDGKIVVAIASKTAHTVWSNAEINCQHSDPPMPKVGPGETATIRQRVYIYEGELDTLYALYKRDFGDNE